MTNYISRYLTYLKKNMTQKEIKPGLVEITTPWLDCHNDCIQIYIEHIGNGTFRISDDGYTFSNISMSERYNSSEKELLLRQIFNRLDIKFNEKQKIFYTICTESEISSAQQRMLQGILDINNIFYD